MNDTQTPIKYTANDIADRAWDNSDDDYLAFLKMKNYALSVEAELTAAREELEIAKRDLSDGHAQWIMDCDIIQAVTEQRDRLAELLPCECIYDSTSPDPTQTCPKCRVLQSLNQPER